MHAFRRCRGMKLAIFNMSGTVVNDIKVINKTLEATMQYFGLNIVERDFVMMNGLDSYKILDHFLIKKSNVNVFPIQQCIIRNVFDNNLKKTFMSRNMVSLIDSSIPQLFDELRYNGTKIALTSEYSNEIQLAIINSLRLGDFIDDRISDNKLNCGKRMIKQLMLNNNINDPRQVMMVSNISKDIYDSTQVKCSKSYGVLSGTCTHYSLNKAGATEILNTVMELK